MRIFTVICCFILVFLGGSLVDAMAAESLVISEAEAGRNAIGRVVTSVEGENTPLVRTGFIIGHDEGDETRKFVVTDAALFADREGSERIRILFGARENTIGFEGELVSINEEMGLALLAFRDGDGTEDLRPSLPFFEGDIEGLPVILWSFSLPVRRIDDAFSDLPNIEITTGGVVEMGDDDYRVSAVPSMVGEAGMPVIGACGRVLGVTMAKLPEDGLGSVYYIDGLEEWLLDENVAIAGNDFACVPPSLAHSFESNKKIWIVLGLGAVFAFGVLGFLAMGPSGRKRRGLSGEVLKNRKIWHIISHDDNLGIDIYILPEIAAMGQNIRGVSGFIVGRYAALCHAVIEHQQVSRRQIRLHIDAKGRVLVEDLNSLNGTYLGNRKLLPFVPEFWAEGEYLSFGEIILVLKNA